ncbi:MAG TPA: phosphoribulokinase [Actinomycetota bacterium]|nr:phosphoribulokinase [Actinomycetota bacterium]
MARPALELARTGSPTRGRPVILAIAGDSAAGKTTLARGVAEVIGPERVTRICTDDYHRYDRRARAELGITPLHPDCNYLDIVEQHLRLLAGGEPILKPVYDHRTGTFAPPAYVRPRDFVVVEGLLPLCTKAMRDCVDVKVYLDPEEELRRAWKLRRDCAERGYEPSEVLAELERREPDAAAFIRPQSAHADIVVRFFRHPRDRDPSEPLHARLVLRPTLPHPDLEGLVGVAGPDGPIRLRLDRDRGKPADVLEISADCPPEAARDVEEAIWRRMSSGGALRRDRLGWHEGAGGGRRSEALALAQLLIVYHLVVAAAGEALEPGPGGDARVPNAEPARLPG